MNERVIFRGQESGLTKQIFPTRFFILILYHIVAFSLSFSLSVNIE